MKKREKNAKKMPRRIIQCLAFAMAFIIGGSSFGVYADNITGILVDDAEHTDLTFDELEYYRMEESTFDAIVADLETLASDTANMDAVTDVIVAMEDYANELSGMYAIAQIYTTLDAENEAYDEELKYCDELWYNIADKIQINYQIIALSACSEALRVRVDDDEEWQEILDYVPMTDEQKELFAQETDLSLAYDELYNKEYTATISGVDYTMESLDEAYSAGTVTWDEYLAGLGSILEARNTEMGELFLQLVAIRDQIAESYGYDNYADYAYEETYGRDYSPEDLEEYRAQIIEYYAPLSDELYDLLFDTYYSEYSAMWEEEISVEECFANMEAYLPLISEDMLVSFHYMLDHEMYDLEVNDAKAPGAYSTTISGFNAPYMFNCADGSYSDMTTLIHEFGHYNQMYYASADEWYYGYFELDLCEIHSQGLEVLFLEYYDEMFGEYSNVLNIYNLFNQVYASVEGAKEDAFQYEVYSNAEGLTLEQVNQMYYDVCLEYGSEDFYNSYYLGLYGVTPADQIYEWIEIPHTFQSPMYYISYSVSMTGAEEIRDLAMDDRDAAIELYLELVERGSENSFQATLEEVGINNPITNPRFADYAENIRIQAGLVDPADTTVPAGSGDVDADIDEEEEVEEEEDDEDDRDRRDDEDEDDEDDRDSRRSSKKEKENMILLVACGIGLFVLVALIIIIVVTVSKNKKKKAEAEAQTNGMPQNMQSSTNNQQFMPPYMQQQMQAQQGTPVQQGMQPQQVVEPQQAAPVQPQMQPQQAAPVQENAQPQMPETTAQPTEQPTEPVNKENN